MTSHSVVFAAAILASLGWVATRPAPDATAPLPFAAAAQEAQPAESEAVEITEMVMGEADAPLEIIEYASFTCPHCAHFHEESLPRLIADYVETGKVRFTYREVYFDRPGLWASMLARCGGEARYFGVAGLIFEKQRDWIGEGQLAQIAENLRTLGKTAGFSEEQVESCLSDAGKAQALVDWFTENSGRDGIQSVPSLMIDGELVKNQSYDKLAAIIDAKLAEAE